MPLTKDIETQIPEAMRAKDSVRLTVLRGIKAASVNEVIAKRRKPEETLSDEETLAVIKRLVNQHRDSIEQFRKGGREELARAEEEELIVLESFLPKMMSADDIRAVAERKKQELGIADKTKMGKLIGSVMKECTGRADGVLVKSVVEKLLANSAP